MRCNPRAARADVLAAGYGERYACPPIARAYADARVSRIYGGTSEVMKELISRGLSPLLSPSAAGASVFTR